MGLSITKSTTLTSWAIPLTTSSDEKWEDNTWIIEHLRHLANKIEEENPQIYSIGIKSDAQYKSQNLVLELFEREIKPSNNLYLSHAAKKIFGEELFKPWLDNNAHKINIAYKTLQEAEFEILKLVALDKSSRL